MGHAKSFCLLYFTGYFIYDNVPLAGEFHYCFYLSSTFLFNLNKLNFLISSDVDIHSCLLLLFTNCVLFIFATSFMLTKVAPKTCLSRLWKIHLEIGTDKNISVYTLLATKPTSNVANTKQSTV